MSVPGRSADLLPKCDVPETDIECLVSEEFLRQDEIDLPEVGELDVIRHFTHLSQRIMVWIRVLSIRFMYNEI